MFGLIRDNKKQIYDRFKKVLSDYEEAIQIGVT